MVRRTGRWRTLAGLTAGALIASCGQQAEPPCEMTEGIRYVAIWSDGAGLSDEEVDNRLATITSQLKSVTFTCVQTSALGGGAFEVLVGPTDFDREAVLANLGVTGRLSLHRVISDDVDAIGQAQIVGAPAGALLAPTTEPVEPFLILEAASAITGAHIAAASAEMMDGVGAPAVILTFDAVGAQLLANLTRQMEGERLAILIDGEVVSAPVVLLPIAVQHAADHGPVLPRRGGGARRPPRQRGPAGC